MVESIHWEGCGGLELDDEIIVTLAGLGALLSLGSDDVSLAGIRSVLVYPGGFLAGDEITPTTQRFGQVDPDGTVIVSWWNTGRRRLERIRQTALHEFAHVLDLASGSLDGTPAVEPPLETRWRSTLREEFLNFRSDESRDTPTILSYYGAEDLSEFFAVSVEAFFERPRGLSQERPALYELLRAYFRLHPADWMRHGADEAFDPPDVDALDDDPSTEALEELSTAIESNPDVSETWARRGVMNHELGRVWEAVADLDKAIEIDSDVAEYWFERGRVLVSIGEFESAIHSLDEANRLSPEEADYLIARGDAKREYAATEFERRAKADAVPSLDLFEPAIRDFSEALSIDEDNPDAYLGRGITYELAGEGRSARLDVDESIRLDAANPEAYESRAMLRENAGDISGAVADWSQVIALEPNDWYGFFMRASLTDQPSDALNDLAHALVLRPDEASLHQLHGELLMQLGRHDEALAAYDTALQFSPEDVETISDLRALRSEALIELGRVEDALAECDRAIDLDPDSSEAWVQRGKLLLYHGDRAGAEDAFRAALASDPEHPGALEGLDELASGDDLTP
ncbi:MAG: zinc-dependent peptidase [Planctomycetota bacterium]